MIKERTHTIDAANKYNVGVRTIQRRVNQLEKENPYLISIYKEVKKNNKNNIPLTEDIEEKISKLVSRPVKISEINDTRREQLEEIERIYNKRCQYLSKTQAAESMGFSINRIYKSLNELYRMRIEENYTKMEGSFKESLKVDVQPQPNTLSNNDEKVEQIVKEGEEK